MGQNSLNLVELTITKLVNGGQAIARLDGLVYFVWNALPGETVRATITRKKKDYAEAIAVEIVVASPSRQKPRDEEFLATSPWQIMDKDMEGSAKVNILEEQLANGLIKLTYPKIDFIQSDKQWHYRNKMEYSFYGDDLGIHLALHQRSSHSKLIVKGSSLAANEIDIAANDLIANFTALGLRAADLKSFILRSSKTGKVSVSLFAKINSVDRFKKLILPDSVQGLKVYFSNPNSPASVPTKLLLTVGEPVIYDDINGKRFFYDADCFFQININIFEKAISYIKEETRQTDLVDMYSGVGAIGLSVAERKIELIEINKVSSDFAILNAKENKIKASVLLLSSEKALKYIPSNKPIIFDPPRSGLHPSVIKEIIIKRPSKIIYLSCNTATLARDIRLLNDYYAIAKIKVLNFFPKTPHIESLVILSQK